jgi:hypothetical protein
LNTYILAVRDAVLYIDVADRVLKVISWETLKTFDSQAVLVTVIDHTCNANWNKGTES